MDAGIRRQEILDRLAATRRPLAATRLGAQLGDGRPGVRRRHGRARA